MSCNANKAFLIENLFNELKTDGDKRIARLNLGVKDSDSLTWGNILGNIYDQEDLVYFVEMLKMLASLTGTVAIFRLNDNTIDQTILDIPEGWQDSLPDTTPQDTLWMTQAVKQGGIYKVGEDGFVWGTPIQINYSNVVDDAQQLEIDELRNRLNTSIQEQQAINNLVDSMNLVTVNSDGSISVTGRDGQVSVWLHLDLGNYLMLGNIYGNSENASTSYFLIDKTGLLQAHNAIIHGTIYATDGYFAGRLDAATGSFRGEVNATSGKIGGWKIIDGTLTPENIPTTALIGKILASQVDFGNTLIDLKSVLSNDYNSKITALRTKLLQNIDSVSASFQLANNSISSSVLELRTYYNQQVNDLLSKLNKEKNDRNTLYLLLASQISQTSNELSLGIYEALAEYNNKFLNYVTTLQLLSELSLLSSKISAKVSQIEYNLYKEVITNKFAELAITPEQILAIVEDKVTGATSSLTLNINSLQGLITSNGELLTQLGITSEGIIMKGNTLAYYSTDNYPVLICNSNGSGALANNNLTWNQEGNLTLTGTINASSGFIGGWSINSDSLTSLVTNRPADEESVVPSQVYTIQQFEINKGSAYEENVLSPYINITTTFLRGYTPLAAFLSVVLNADGLSIKNGNRNNPSLTVTTNYIGLNNGFLANNNINWDNENNVTIKFTQSSGGVTYDITLDNLGIHYVDQDDTNNRGTLEWTALIDNVS